MKAKSKPLFFPGPYQKHGPGIFLCKETAMDGRKIVKYKLKPGESVKAGDLEIELIKHRPGTPSHGAVAEILIHAPENVLIYRAKKRGKRPAEPGEDE